MAMWCVDEVRLRVPSVCVWVGVSRVHVYLGLTPPFLEPREDSPPCPHFPITQLCPLHLVGGGRGRGVQSEGDMQSDPVPVSFTLSRFSSDRFLRPLSATNTS